MRQAELIEDLKRRIVDLTEENERLKSLAGTVEFVPREIGGGVGG